MPRGGDIHEYRLWDGLDMPDLPIRCPIEAPLLTDTGIWPGIHLVQLNEACIGAHKEWVGEFDGSYCEDLVRQLFFALDDVDGGDWTLGEIQINAVHVVDAYGSIVGPWEEEPLVSEVLNAWDCILVLCDWWD